MFNEICILAPGLLGASLLVAARERALAKRLTLWARREETRQICAQQSWCDSVFETPEDAVKTADLVVICTPVDIIPELTKQIAPKLKAGALVTDVGSTKEHICTTCDAFMPKGVTFIGSHPMAGSEKTGLEHADPQLFQGRPCFVTPLEHTPMESTEWLSTFWEAVGMQIYQADPAEHDTIVANISHLPHLLASALCNKLATNNTNWLKVAGAGLKDHTRIAAGNPKLWRAIFEQNSKALITAVRDTEQHIARMRDALENKDFDQVEKLLEEAKQCRERY